MKKMLKMIGLVMALGLSSQVTLAQECGPGGQVTDGVSFGLPPSYCYYTDGSCTSHPTWQIPAYCRQKWESERRNKSSAPTPVKPSNEATFRFTPPSGKLGPEVHYFGVVGRDDATGDDVVRRGGDLNAVRKSLMEECPNCRFIFYWTDTCAGQAKAKQANGKLKSYYATGDNAGQAKQNALKVCKAENPNGCSGAVANCRGLNP